MRLVVVVVGIYHVQAYPSLVGCDRVIDVGETIMGAAAVADTTRMWVIERGADVVACGGEYVPGETLNARIDDSSGLRYIMELLEGGTFDQSDGGCDGNLCAGIRCAKGTNTASPDGSGQALIAPTDGTDIVLHGAWASGFGGVNVIEDCVLTAPPTGGGGGGGIVVPPGPMATVPPYAIVTDGTCVSHGMIDILEEDECRLVMNDGYYSTRDQDSNGILDAEQDYPIPVVDGLPPGCWPVEPGAAGFENATFPFACITPLETAVGNCSDFFPCFCRLPEYEIVKEGTCVSAGMTDILDESLCRAVMDDGYYSTRDQDNNGLIDAFQDYPIPVVDGLPPGCWPVEPGAAGFENATFPFACITQCRNQICISIPRDLI